MRSAWKWYSCGLSSSSSWIRPWARQLGAISWSDWVRTCRLPLSPQSNVSNRYWFLAEPLGCIFCHAWRSTTIQKSQWFIQYYRFHPPRWCPMGEFLPSLQWCSTQWRSSSLDGCWVWRLVSRCPKTCSQYHIKPWLRQWFWPSTLSRVWCERNSSLP